MQGPWRYKAGPYSTNEERATLLEVLVGIHSQSADMLAALEPCSGPRLDVINDIIRQVSEKVNAGLLAIKTHAYQGSGDSDSSDSSDSDSGDLADYVKGDIFQLVVVVNNERGSLQQLTVLKRIMAGAIAGIHLSEIPVEAAAGWWLWRGAHSSAKWISLQGNAKGAREVDLFTDHSFSWKAKKQGPPRCCAAAAQKILVEQQACLSRLRALVTISWCVSAVLLLALLGILLPVTIFHWTRPLLP